MAKSMENIDDLRADLEEACQMRDAAARPSNKRKLDEWASELQHRISRVESAASSPPVESAPAAPVTPAAPSSAPVKLSSQPAVPIDDGKRWQELPSFAWDQGEYNSKWVTVYCTSGLDGVGEVKQNVTCDFTKSTFDLKVVDLNGKSFRLYKDNLDKDIIPEESKFSVKKNSINIKLKKVKGEYSYENWTDLVSKKTEEQKQKTKEDPMGGIMDMMKDMYDNGDDQMKRTIGEAMSKANKGQPGGVPDLPSM